MDAGPYTPLPPSPTQRGRHETARTATLCLDRELRVRWVTPTAGALFNVGAAAVGQPLADLRHDFACEGLLDDARTVRDTLQPTEKAFRQRGTDWHVHLSPCYTGDDKADGVVLTFTERPTRGQRAKEVVAMIDEERRRLGQDLHELLASQLAGTAMVVRALEERINHDMPSSADEMSRLADLIHAASDQAGWLSHTLMPPLQMHGEDMVSRLRHFVEQETTMRLGISTTFSAEGMIPKLDDGVADHLYRIAADAIWNAAKREKVSTIQVSVATRGDRLVLSVQDDGGIIPVDSTRVDEFGQRLLAYRAALIGASIEIDTLDGTRNRVQCHVPLKNARHDAAR